MKWDNTAVKCLNFVTVLQFMFLCHTGYSEPELPPAEFPRDNITYKIIPGSLDNTSASLNVPPHIFPEDNSNYTIINNATILNSLVSHEALRNDKDENSSTKQTENKTDTEVQDLLKPIDHSLPEVKDVKSETVTSPEVKDEVKNQTGLVEKTVDPLFDSELIESDVSKTEDAKLNVSATKSLSAVHVSHNHMSRGGPMVQGQLAAIFAGVFAMIAVFCYIGLLTWRRYLEHRYGNREMLINEEEYINYSDMKNFEL